VSARIALVFFIVIGGATLAVASLYLVSQSSMRYLHSAEQHFTPVTRTANEFEREILNARIHFIYFVTIQKPGSLDLGHLRYANAQQKISDLKSLTQNDEGRDGLQPLVLQLAAALDKYDVELEAILKAVQGGLRSGPEYDLLVKSWAGAGATLVQNAAQLEDAAAKCSAEAQDHAASNLNLVTILAILIMVLGTAVGAVSAIVITRTIRADLSDAALQLERGAEQVASAASQVSASAQSMAEGASRQAAFLHNTTVSWQKVDSISQKNSHGSLEAHAQTDSASVSVNDTLQKLTAMSCSMKDIVSASRQISTVATAIDGIAFQTNLLALNAAVEAARAGENGLGFAVVADEVRSLAQRSSQAARETQYLIEGSIEKSNDGDSRLHELSDSISAMSDKLTQVRELVRGVSEGSQEQKLVLAEVTAAVSEIDRVTQQSAAYAEQTATAGSQLAAQSDSMKSLVANLGDLIGTTR
jgi:methyl-accepting chemotaxis protein